MKARPESTGKLGAVGFCFGGGIVNTLVTRMPDLAAAVPFYGTPPPAADVPKIKAAVLVHHGEMDGYVYPKAQHGFHNDTMPRYDEAAAKLAWQRTLDWFKKYLR